MMADPLSIQPARRHIFLCADPTKPTSTCCDKDSGLEAWEYLKRRLEELGLSRQGGVYRTKVNCLRLCRQGPIAVVLSGWRLVSFVFSTGFGNHYSRTPHRRQACFPVSNPP